MTKQLGFYFEQKHCVGCSTCQIACKDKNNLEVGQLFRKVYEISGGDYIEKGTAIVPEIYAFWVSMSCNHCINPACVKNCPTGAMKKRSEDGIVYIDQEQCIGCLRCVKSCPYDSPQYNPATKKVGKCNFCMDLLSIGKQPVCVTSCPLRALNYGELDLLQQKYGTVNETKGIPRADITEPALVIAPHNNAINR
ncbi:DMSO/selenate family reductase complex B subunit [Clostridium sp. DJ247]|uniref:DMSO/selenate family reductase complex B subunit n=1 Tax=Clostridium sp. DJ247 TaxID=2726188 RepID=UPI001629F2DC|nr:DMSO/selenate family reductase complex B subunit [Clostridium sp. DJ247]MBC2582495.1 dimethylsulfoxide reductase subunit B [Clostridium sp. DJ247]